jgi:predicted AAA+ superfamily ATPase
MYRIKRQDAFRKLLSLAASQIGNLVNFSNWTDSVGVSVNTVIEYVNLMAKSHFTSVASSQLSIVAKGLLKQMQIISGNVAK